MNTASSARLHPESLLTKKILTADDYLKEGRELLYSGQYKKAIEKFEQVLAIDKGYFKAYASIGMAYMKLGDKETANRYFSYANNNSSGSEVDNHIRLSASYEGSKESWDSHFQRGEEYYRNSMFTEAIEEYKASLKFKEDSYLSYFSMGSSYKNIGDIKMAADSWQKALQYNPGDKLVKRLLAKIKEESDKTDEMERLKKEVEKDQSNLSNIFSIGLWYMNKGDYKNAEEQFNTILKRDPQNRDAVLGLSALNSSAGDITKSIAILQDFLKVTKKDKTVFAQLQMLTEYNDLFTNNPFISKGAKGDLNSEMVFIKGGAFYMGSDNTGIETGVDEKPMREVYTAPFYIDKYEVTNLQYKKFVIETGHEHPFHWKQGGEESHTMTASFDGDFYPEGGDFFPVTYVTWHDADAFCKWAGKTLPTEAEWEKAARGEDRRKFPWGDTLDSHKANSAHSNFKGPLPVGSYPEGVSPYGVFDMSGNVWEWTADIYDRYKGSTLERDAFNSNTRVVRGGSFLDPPEIHTRTSERHGELAGMKHRSIGFRCVKKENPLKVIKRG